MVRVTSFGVADALAENGMLKVPMVIIVKNENDDEIYEGFVPGLRFNLVRSKNMLECEDLLKEITVAHIKEMIIEKLPFPFFPTRKEIEEDFNGVKKIIYLNINSEKIKNKK